MFSRWSDTCCYLIFGTLVDWRQVSVCFYMVNSIKILRLSSSDLARLPHGCNWATISYLEKLLNSFESTPCKKKTFVPFLWTLRLQWPFILVSLFYPSFFFAKENDANCLQVMSNFLYCNWQWVQSQTIWENVSYRIADFDKPRQFCLHIVCLEKVFKRC